MEEDQPTTSTTNKTKGPFFRLAPPAADSGGEDQQNIPQRKESINTEGTAHSMFGQINGIINNKMATSTALLTNTNSSTIFRPLIHDVANKQVAEKLATFLHGIQKKNLIRS